MKNIIAAAVLGGSIVVAAVIVAPKPATPTGAGWTIHPEPSPIPVYIVGKDCTRAGGGPGGVWGRQAACELDRP